MKKHNILFSCLLSMAISSCTENETLGIENQCESQVLFSVDDFIPESLTRTNCDPSNNYKITWASGDAIGIFPREGDQEPFVIPAEQVGQSKAAFDGGYWALKDGKTYNAYYPFSRENYASSEMKTMIPVTYLGQYQNGTECNVGAFDYTYSDWKESVGGASVSFSFHHIGSFLVLTLPIPATTTYTSLSVSVDEEIIPVKGKYDLTASSPVFVSTDVSSSLSMTLNNFNGVAGQSAVFYMMIPPVDLSAKNVFVTLASASGSCSYSVASKNIAAAKLYKLTGTPVESTVEGTIDSWLYDYDESIPYLTFSSAAEQSLSMTYAVSTLEYSVNGGAWNELGTNVVSFGGSKGKIKVRGLSSHGTGVGTLTPSECPSFVFGTEAAVDCEGDIRTLVDYKNYATADCSQARFNHLFAECSVLTSAPRLPSMVLASSCYEGMFIGCTNLVTAPVLPATELSEACYYQMFLRCSNLLNVPALPATNLASSCYREMFWGCSSITSAPELPALSLVNYCYDDMFKGCTKLNYIKMSAVNIIGTTIFGDWVQGVAPTGTFVKNHNATWENDGIVPEGWNVVYDEELSANGHEYIDLGLIDTQGRPIYWATMNVGSEAPEDAGSYFAWAEVETKHDYYVDNYQFFDKNIISFERLGNISNTDNDVAHVKWGKTWRIPTNVELQELYDNCTWTWETINSMAGYRVTGTNGNSIFLPCGGFCVGFGDAAYLGGSGFYWASNQHGEDQPGHCVYLYFSTESIDTDNNVLNCTAGMNIRPVSSYGIVDSEHQAVDLGLPSGLLWATTNIGSSVQEECGEYYAWGEVEPKYYYKHDNYAHCIYTVAAWEDLGDICGSSTYDVARKLWGGRWSMPSSEDFEILASQCVWNWTTINSVKGYKITGPNGNSIFLPSAGLRYTTGTAYVNDSGMYWTGTQHAGEYQDRAFYLWFGYDEGNHKNYISPGNSAYDRSYAASVRPVIKGSVQ